MSFRALRVFENPDGSFRRELVTLNQEELPAGEVTIRVAFSSLNYKDALSASGNRGVTRHYPHTPGCDSVGVVETSTHSNWRVGQRVLVTGYDLGMNTHGGYSELIRVPGNWVVALPDRLSFREAMTIGTAGYTAALALHNLEKYSFSLKGGSILVTGASGGVGSFAVALFSSLGYSVTACTGKAEAHEFLRELGAKLILSRQEFMAGSGRVLEKGKWGGVLDTVGGDMLPKELAQCMPGACVACCGMVSKPVLSTSLMPFLLRGVRLIGLAAAQSPMALRLSIWERLSSEWKIPDFSKICREVDLQDLEKEISLILTGKQVGRVVVRVGERHV